MRRAGCARVIEDLLLPSTDAGVYAQVALVAVGYLVALWFVRRNRELVVFVSGLAVFLAGLMALRTVH